MLLKRAEKTTKICTEMCFKRTRIAKREKPTKANLEKRKKP
jgi:hypothetical protein